MPPIHLEVLETAPNVVVGGKAVHTTVQQGQGGDAFAFEVGVPSTRGHPVSAS
jgi:hypothetical protein